MTRIHLRVQAVLMIACVSLLLLVSGISPYLPEKIGVLQATAFDGETSGMIYLDLDTGLLASHTLPEQSQSAMVAIPFDDLSGNLLSTDTTPQTFYYFVPSDGGGIDFIHHLDTGTTTLAHFETLIPVISLWHDEESILLVALDGSGNTILSTLALDGTVSELITLPDFEGGFVHQSPDGRYVLLREGQADTFRMVVSAKPMVLIDLETLQVRDMGTPDFAYWSPDSQKIAMGHISADNRFEVNVSVYDLATEQSQAMPFTVSRIDVPFFPNETLLGVRWSPDSQGLVTINQYTETLTFTTLAGDMTTIENSNLKPYRWSPDGTRLITIGYYQDQRIGAYVVNIADATVTYLDTDVSPTLWQNTLLWTENGRYVVVATADNIQVMTIEGELVRDGLTLIDEQGLRGFVQTLQWVDRVTLQ